MVSKKMNDIKTKEYVWIGKERIVMNNSRIHLTRGTHSIMGQIQTPIFFTMYFVLDMLIDEKR